MPTSLSTPQTLPLGYTQAATLGPIQNLEKIVWQNTGGVVVFQVGRLNQSGKVVFDQTEAVLPPGIWGMDKIYGIRFRSRDVAALATLDPCTGYFEDDPDPFNPGTVPGSTAAITGAVNVQHNDALVASQPTLDFEDSGDATFAWVITNDGANTRVKITPPNVVTSAFGRDGAVVATSGDYVASQVTNAADKASASQQTFTGNLQTPALGVNTAPGAAGQIFLTGRIFSGASGTGGMWVDGATQFVGSLDSTHQGFFQNAAWRMTVSDGGSVRTPNGGSFVGGLTSSAQTPTVTYTPNFDVAESFILSIGGAGGGTLTIANVSSPPSSTQTAWMYIEIFNPPGNATTNLSWGTTYYGGAAGLPASIAQGVINRLFFVWNGGSWILMSRINV